MRRTTIFISIALVCLLFDFSLANVAGPKKQIQQYKTIPSSIRYDECPTDAIQVNVDPNSVIRYKDSKKSATSLSNPTTTTTNDVGHNIETRATYKCLDGEKHDSGVLTDVTGTSWCCTSSCMNSRGEYVQLFEPPIIPWQYTAICFSLYHYHTWDDGTVDMSLEFLYQEEDRTPQQDPFAVIPFTATITTDDTYVWFSVNISSLNFISFEKALYIGLSHTLCDVDQFIYMGFDYNPSLTPWLEYTRRYPNDTWESPMYWYPDTGTIRATLIRASGVSAPLYVPYNWTCDIYDYNDGSICNCECGMVDPDCYIPDNTVTGCVNSSYICISGNGECVAFPSSCNRSTFGTKDGCQCGNLSCALPDPDCDVWETTYGCSDSYSTCNSDGTCGAPVWWGCDFTWYGDSMCDCGCGYPDVDCDLYPDPVYGCDYDIEACIDGVCTLVGWICDPDYYFALDDCDCACGIFDPDCEYLTPAVNCLTTQVCSINGTCVDPGCGNGRIDDGEQCELGAYECNSNCTCNSGYTMSDSGDPYDFDCVPDCGDGIIVDDEECDSGLECNNCVCSSGFYPYDPPEKACGPICRNSVLDPDTEECDLGVGCTINCTCSSGYKPQNSVDCKKSKSSDTVGIAVGVSLGGVGIIALAVLCGVIFVMFKRMKKQKPAEQTIKMGSMTSQGEKFDSRGSTFLELPKMPLEVTDPKKSVDMTAANPRLTFGMSSHLAPVDKDIVQELLVRNTGTSRKAFKLFLPHTEGKYTINIFPATSSLDKGEEVTIACTVRILCTTRLNLEIPFAVCSGSEFKQSEQHSFINLTLESALTTKLDPDELVLVTPAIGEGFYGTVYKGEWRTQEVAVKILKNQSVIDQKMMDAFMHEINLMENLRVPQVVHYVGAVHIPGKLAIVTEFLGLGSLHKALKAYEFPYSLKLHCLLDICRGMNFLHQSSLLHRDLKPENVLIKTLDVKAPVCCKITDFGTSRDFAAEASMTKGVGTPIFMAPEVISSNNYTSKADVYSFALVIYEVVSEIEPFSTGGFETAWKITDFVAKGNRLPIPDACTPELSDMMNKCWDQEPNNRPEFLQLISTLEPIVEQEMEKKGKKAKKRTTGGDDSNPAATTSGSGSTTGNTTTNKSTGVSLTQMQNKE